MQELEFGESAFYEPVFGLDLVRGKGFRFPRGNWSSATASTSDCDRLLPHPKTGPVKDVKAFLNLLNNCLVLTRSNLNKR